MSQRKLCELGMWHNFTQHPGLWEGEKDATMDCQTEETTARKKYQGEILLKVQGAQDTLIIPKH